MFRRLLALPLLLLAPLGAQPQKTDSPATTARATDPLASADTFSGLRFRSIGPALFSGRIAGFAVHPTDRNHYYVAVASGGVWKTTNAGTTWIPLFDDQPSYSIGAIALDPKDPHTVWVGTGENNAQRSVGHGDGVYRSSDAGKSWQKMGLEKSEHIGKILIDPRDSNTIYVAAQGPLWNSGGDRGLYKSSDAGKTWRRVLHVSDDTGITDIVCDPRNPDVLLAASWQRRRHVWTLVNGGPESAVHRSTDGGNTWKKISGGLPGGDLGRIGLAVAPSRPEMVYATVEASEGKGGIFRSLDFGRTWERRNPYDSLGMYYGHLVVDPTSADRLFVMNVVIQTSEDGGTTLKPLPMKSMHVDCHCMWIDPANPQHYRVGCDGGIYESFDAARNWKHIRNLPVTQFYDVAADEAGPFYHVYGGTQDNCTLGGPARTRTVSGASNADWFVVHFGDGFQCKVDPRDPSTVYAEAQYGDLVRFDRKSGESIGIRPTLPASEPPLRWNWDSPLLLSSHQPTRLYFAANRLFRSDDRGDSWKVISPDLTRQIDRNRLPVMGKLWGPDAIYRHGSTSFYGNLVTLAESPLDENLLYVGSDDGLIQRTVDGKTWTKLDRFPGVPERTYVSRVVASRHAAGTVYAAFNNHKNGDFKPYLLRSQDQGKTWSSITGNLPADGPVWCLVEDPEEPDLLFAGTEFGLFVTLDAGKTWARLKGGLPTVGVRDLVIQKQMNDLVVGTFGRGIYILDDYTPLRRLTKKTLEQQATLFPVREALQYIPARPFGGSGKGFQGEDFYTAENPPFGAVVTYHLNKSLESLKQKRQAAEKKGSLDKHYPTPEELRAEAEEEPPVVVLEIRDAAGEVVRRLTGPATKGFHRLAWDLREPSPSLPPLETGQATRRSGDTGPLVLPGTYKVRLLLREKGEWRPVEGAEQEVRVRMEGPVTPGRKQLYEFQKQIVSLRKALAGTLEQARLVEQHLGEMRRAVDHTPRLESKDRARVLALQARLRAITRELRGDSVLRARNENTPESISEKVGTLQGELRYSLAAPTRTQRELYGEASAELAVQLGKLRELAEKDVAELAKVLDVAGAPWTGGRWPQWK